MTGSAVPDKDHILRYVGGRHVDGKVITGGGFIARPKDNNKPSYNWLECFPGTYQEQVQSIRNVARIKYGTTARLAKLNVGTVKKYVRKETPDDHAIEVLHDPLDKKNGLPEDPSHAVMTNIPCEDDPKGEMIGDLIVDCVCDVLPAKKKS